MKSSGEASCKIDADPRKCNEIPRDTPCKMDACLRKFNEILRGTPYKMDARPWNSKEIQSGTPCKLDADPSKLDEIRMAPMAYKYRLQMTDIIEIWCNPRIYPFLHSRNSEKTFNGVPLPITREFCKSSEVSGVPLPKCSHINRKRLDPKGYPSQGRCKSVEIKWNPKGYPLAKWNCCFEWIIERIFE
jgi:hypothetical protein